MKKLLALVVVALLLAGCSAVEPTSDPVGQEPAKTYALGETWTHDNIEYTVTNVRTGTGSQYFKPEKDMIWVFVEVLVENKSKEDFAVSSLMMFEAHDEESYSYDITIADGQKGSLDGTVGSGRKLKGELAFEMPKATKKLELQITPDLLSTTHVVFALEIK